MPLAPVACILLLCLPAAGQSHYIIPGAVPDIPYKPGLTLDAYAPRGEPRPAALVIEGGRGGKRGYVTRLFPQLTQAGYSWFAPDYRSEADVAAALRFIRQPGRFNIHRRVTLIGEHAGAGIALRLAAQDPRIAGVVTLGAARTEASPGVPVLMIHGAEDTEWPPGEAEAFCRSLKNCRFYRQAGARHTFENWLPAQWDYQEELNAWLRGDRRGLWKDIVYARPHGLELKMDAWIPEGPGPFPAVIIAHGGGWEGGDKVTYAWPVFEPLAQAGFAWFSIDYRLTPYVRNEEQLEDLRAAIRYVKKHAARYHVDADRVALLGESASGQMVTLVASQPCVGCEVRAVVSFYGVYKFDPADDPNARRRLLRLFGPYFTPEILRRHSPLWAAHSRMAPILLLQGTKDNLAAGTQEYAARLRELGVRHDLVMIEGAPHGVENWLPWPEWKSRMTEWLRRMLAGPG